MTVRTPLCGLLCGLCAWATLAVEEPLFENNIIVSLPRGLNRGITGDIERLKDGSLLFVYQTGAGIVGRKSTDEGKTWGDEFPLHTSQPPPTVASPSLLRMDNGEILLSYLVLYNSGDCHQYVRISSDECKTWGEPICSTPYPGYHTGNNDRLVQLTSGRIISPVDWCEDYNKEWHFRAVCYYSDDRGRTWLRGGVVDLGTTTEEPGVVELKDGRLLEIFRSEGGYVGKAYSSDGGITWTEPEMIKQLPAPRGPATIVRIPKTGDLLIFFLYNQKVGEGSERKRAPLATAISRDEGETWTNFRTELGPDPEGDYGYVGCTFIGDMALVNFHSMDGIHVARVGVDWFYQRVYRETFDNGAGGWLAYTADGAEALEVRDGAIVSPPSPWWVDPNHAPPGGGYLHLLAYLWTSPALATPGTNRFVDEKYPMDFTNAKMTVRLKGELDAKGAELVLLAQGHVGDKMINSVLMGQPFKVTPEWTEQTITLVPDDAQWKCMGSRHDRLATYGWAPIADLLKHVDGDIIFVLHPLDVQPKEPIQGDPHILMAGADYEVDQSRLPSGWVMIDEVKIEFAGGQ